MYQHAEDIQPYLLSLLKGLPKVQWVVSGSPNNAPGMYLSTYSLHCFNLSSLHFLSAGSVGAVGCC